MSSTRPSLGIPAAVWYTLGAALLVSLLVIGISLFYLPGIGEDPQPMPAGQSAR